MATVALNTVVRHIHRLAAAGLSRRTDRELLDKFNAGGDEAAFAALVRRHGPMVLRVCRRVLRQEQDAEDAFQATFLVLARRVGSIRRREALAQWLHGVAYRTAMQARRKAARRRKHEARLSTSTREAALAPTWDDIQPVLDEEIQRLPEDFRAAFVLCVLEGKTVPEAAAELGVKSGTVSSRVARARQRLRQQLAQRGIELGSLLAALAVAEGVGKAAVPPTLAVAALRCGLSVAAGGSSAGGIPTQVAALAAGVTRAMFLSKAKIAVMVIIAMGFLAAGALRHQAVAAKETSPIAHNAAPPAKEEPQPQAARSLVAKDEQDNSIEVSGRVVDRHGRPVPGAKVFFARSVLAFRGLPPPMATSDHEGRFRLRVSRTGYQTDHEKGSWLRGAVVAVGQGFAPGWVGGDKAEQFCDVTIKLANDVPVEGRVVDLQGRPVAGVRVLPRTFGFREDAGSLKEFVESLKTHTYSFPGTTIDAALVGLTRSTVTGSDGKFRLTGVSGECVVGLHLEGPTIETVEVYALTRSDAAVSYPLTALHFVFYGPKFDHAAAPTRPVVGSVRDKDTGKPIVGVTVRARIRSFVGFTQPYVSTTTGADGRYRFVGLYDNFGHDLELLPATGQPYLPGIRSLGASTGSDPVTADFPLKRGVVIRGRVTDKQTGRPLRATLAYFALVGNPHLKEAPEFHGTELQGAVNTGEDGSYALVGLPGPGMLVVQAAGGREDRYLMAVGADEIQGSRFEGGYFDTEPSLIDPYRFNTLAPINPAKDAEGIERNLVLDPGKTVTGTIVDPDGKTVKGVSIEPARGIGFRVGELPSAEFRISAIDPKQPQWFLFRHHGKNLGAAVLVKGDEPAPLTVRLQKCATIAGRLLDEEGQPRRFATILSGIESGQLNVNNSSVFGGHPDRYTGKGGRFRIEGVLPGLKAAVYAAKTPRTLSRWLPGSPSRWAR